MFCQSGRNIFKVTDVLLQSLSPDKPNTSTDAGVRRRLLIIWFVLVHYKRDPTQHGCLFFRPVRVTLDQIVTCLLRMLQQLSGLLVYKCDLM